MGFLSEILDKLKGKKDDKKSKDEKKNKSDNEKKEENKKVDFNWLYHKKERRWDDLNRPIGYIVGVTPGFAQISRSPENFKDLGLMRKYMKGALYGFEFIQLDFEAISEINERYLWKMIDEAKRYQGLEIGIHAPVTGEAAVDLGVAYANQWSLHHRTIQRSAYACGEILGAKYFLFHSSSSPRPNIVYGLSGDERYGMRGQLFSYTGISLGLWIKQIDGEKETIFEGESYPYFVDPCYRKKYFPLEDFKFKDYFKARFLSVLLEIRGYALDPDLGLYFYYFDSFEEGLKKAQEYRKDARNRIFLYYVNLLRKNINEEIQNLKDAIQRIEQQLNREGISDEERNRLEGLRTIYSTALSELERINNEKIESMDDIHKLNLTPEGFEALTRPEVGIIPRIIPEFPFESPINLLPSIIVNHFERKVSEIEKDIATDNLGDYSRFGLTPQEKRGLKVIYRFVMLGMDLDEAFDYWVTVKGSEATEEVAYVMTAKFMYKYQDYLWQEIVGKRYETGIDDAYDPDDVILAANLGFKRMWDFYNYKEKNGEMPFIGRLNKYKKEFRDFIRDSETRTPLQIAEDIVTAVAAKYIQGHLFVKDEWAMDTLPEWLYKIGALSLPGVKFNNESVWDYIERGGSKTDGKPILVFVETEQPPKDSLAGRLRIMKAKHHIILVKSVVEYASKLIEEGGPDIIPRDQGPYKDIFSYNMDFEHLSTNLIDPVEDVKTLDDGEGAYIKMLHVNAPRPYGGQHGPLFMLNEELYTLYEWMWTLRQKGMKNAYFIWEMGSYGIFQTALAFRRMAIALENDIPPDELPPEFYGIDETILAEQKRVLIEHAYDPLEGLLLQPEEKHTFLGSAAREKGRLDKWLGEEHR